MSREPPTNTGYEDAELKVRRNERSLLGLIGRLHLESIRARSGLEDCLSSLKDIAKEQNPNSQPTEIPSRLVDASV
jgi:hypothetical protein